MKSGYIRCDDIPSSVEFSYILLNGEEVTINVSYIHEEGNLSDKHINLYYASSSARMIDVILNQPNSDIEVIESRIDLWVYADHDIYRKHVRDAIEKRNRKLISKSDRYICTAVSRTAQTQTRTQNMDLIPNNNIDLLNIFCDTDGEYMIASSKCQSLGGKYVDEDDN